MARKYKNNIAEDKGKFYIKLNVHGEQRQMLAHGAKTREQAQAILDAERYKLRQEQAGLIKKESKFTVYNSLDRFLKYSEVNKKSYKTDLCRVKLLKEIIPENLLLVKVKPEHIENWKNKLSNKGLSPTTVNKYLALLSKTFTLEVNNKNIEYNPCSMVKYFNKVNTKIRYLTKEEEKQLFLFLPEYLKDIVNVALYTGLRKENILGLRWDQIDFKLNNIEILENKGNKHIILPIIEPLNLILEKLYKQKDNEYVFVNPKTKTRYYEIDKAWRESLKLAGIENFRFHDLRHTVGTRLAEKGIPVNVIKEILAHSDIRTTMKYIHLVEGSKREALSSLL